MTGDGGPAAKAAAAAAVVGDETKTGVAGGQRMRQVLRVACRGGGWTLGLDPSSIYQFSFRGRAIC